MRAGLSVMTASTPRVQAQVEIVGRVHGPHVDAVALLAEPAPEPGSVPELVDSRSCDPTWRQHSLGDLPRNGSLYEEHHFQGGASFCTRVRATPEKLITRAGDRGPAQPNSSSVSTRRRSTRPPKRVGCLVSMARSTCRS